MKIKIGPFTLEISMTCRKVKYHHRVTADAACLVMEKKGSGKMESYFCSDCQNWHIGHPRG